MSLYSRLDRLAADVEKLNRQITAVANSPQSQRTSVEGGSIDFNDADGNLMAIMGGQDDGSNTIRHVDGPTPPIPSGLSAHVDGPIVQVSWDGTFETSITHDWHYLEVLAVGPNNEQLTGTINDLNGGETSLAATSQGDWFITARSVSRAGKRSLDGDAGTVAVQLVGLTGAIDAVQESANGKNTIYYSPTEPVAPDGGFNNGDLWFDTSEEGNNTASVWDGNGWVSMEDARLATIIAAQEALESDLQDVQTSVDGKNTITWDPAAPTLSTPGKAVNDIWYRTSGNSIIGYWKWSGSAWVQQTLSATVIPQIDIGAGTFGSLSGSRLEVGSVTADKVLVGNGTDLIADGGFIAPFGVSWQVASGTSDSWRIERPVSGTNYLVGKQVGSGWKSAASYPAVRVTAGQQYLVAADFRTPTIWPTGYPRIEVYVYDGDGVRIQAGSVANAATNTTEWQSISGTLTVPAGGVSMVFVAVLHSTTMPGSEVYVRNPTFRLKTGATLIENGAITTDKLAVGSITAESGVIASVDLGKATVGELDGIRIMGRTVRGEQLSGDAIDGKVITGGTYRTSGGNGSWSDAGLFINQPDGTSMVRFPTDGTPLSLTASDTQIERASVGELDVSYCAVRSGGTMTLASGVTAPASPPELTAGWKFEAQLPRPAEPSMDWAGLAVWNGLYVRGVNVLTSAGDPYDRIELYNPDGTLNRSISIDINPRAGVAVIGDIVYTIGPDHSPNNTKNWCHGFNLNTGARVSRWEFTRFFASNQKKIAIGVDGSNLLVAGITPSAMLNVMRYNPSTGAQVGSDMTTAFDVGYSTDIHGVEQSGGKIYVSPREQVREYTVSGSTLTKTAGFAWDNPNRNSGGFTFVDGAPLVVDSGAVYKGSVSASDYTREMCFTWYDGTHETTASPVATIDVGARETVTISLPVRAGLQKRLYSRAAGGSNWSRSVVPADVTVSPAPVGIAVFTPPSTNTFPNADPATLKSTNDKFEVKGDGSGHWGPLTFGADGTMTGIRQTSSGTLTVSAPSDGGTTSTWVTFPEGRFTTAPTVTTSLRSTAPNSSSVSTGGATATGFYIYFYRVNDNPTGVNWIAAEEG